MDMARIETLAFTTQSADRLICSVLCGEPEGWPWGGDSVECSRFIERLEYHGVAPLVDQALAGSYALESWPSAIVAHCHGSVRAQAIYEMASRVELSRVLDAFAQSGIKALLLKGTPLAYTHYNNAALRPRGDTDLLVPRGAKEEVEAILERLGYTRFPGVTGDYITYQSLWIRTDALGVAHDLDLHWRVNNSQVLAKLFDYEELETRAMELPALGARAYGLAPVDALLFACMHRSGHRNAPYYIDNVPYPATDRLIWLYDIHLLVSRMSEDELLEFVALAASKRMKAICRDGLVRSMECFRTVVSDPVLRALVPSGAVEPSARYCNEGRVLQMVDDFFALETLRARASWLREQAFPPAEYMRGKYEGAAWSWLPWLYARRAAHGLWRLAVPSPHSD
ncbi:MAG: nucleotidyltransferase family protein [Betaproteobacteria bacterium]|nr:nucleotidyltransferase family protein [Betaproteobacteria bacterium]